MGLLRRVCLEEAGLEEAGLKEAGLKEAGLEEAGLMQTTCGSVGPQSPKIIPRRRCWKACRKHILRHPLRIVFKFEDQTALSDGCAQNPKITVRLDKAGLEEASHEEGGLEEAGLEEAGLEEAGLEEAGHEEAGLEEAGLMRATCRSTLAHKAQGPSREGGAGKPVASTISITPSKRPQI